MNTIKRRKLKNKRTPWAVSRYARKARARRALLQRAIVARGAAHVMAIRSATGMPAHEKAAAIADAVMRTHAAVAKVPFYGAMYAPHQGRPRRAT